MYGIGQKVVHDTYGRGKVIGILNSEYLVKFRKKHNDLLKFDYIGNIGFIQANDLVEQSRSLVKYASDILYLFSAFGVIFGLIICLAAESIARFEITLFIGLVMMVGCVGLGALACKLSKEMNYFTEQEDKIW